MSQPPRAAYAVLMLTGLRERLAPPYAPAEWIPALVLLVWSVLDIASSDSVVGSRAALLVGALVASGALVGRRRAPLLVLLTTGVTVLGPAALGAHAQSPPLVLVLVVAVFSVARYERRPWAYAGLPLGILFAVIGSAAGPRETVASSWTWSLNVVWIFGIGLWLSDSDRRVEAVRGQAEADARAAAAEERLRVARELHDVLAHSLSLMVVQAEVADELLSRDPERARGAVGSIQAAGRSALKETRGVLGLLRDSSAIGVSRLPELVASFREAGLPVTLETDDVALADPRADAAVYRVVQEALTNAVRHSGSPATLVRVVAEDGSVRVRVEHGAAPATNGPTGPAPGSVGTRVDDPPVLSSGHGLVGMRERVEACGGRLSARPGTAGGFVVEALLPSAGSPA